jgi:hypothetical protein
VGGHLLGEFELAAVFEVIGNAGGAKTVIAGQAADAGLAQPAADHAVRARLIEGPALQRPAPPSPEERSFGVAGDAGGRQIFIEKLFQRVMTRQFVHLAAFFLQPQPAAASLDVIVFDAQLDHRADAGEGVGHGREQRAIAQRHQRVGREAGEQVVHLLGREHRRFALLDHMFWSAHGMGRIVGDDLADDQPVEEHAHGRQMLFHGRPGAALGFERFEPGGDMHRLDAAQLFQTMGRTPSRKAAHGAIVGAAGMVVGNLGDKEFQGTFSRALARAGFLEKEPRRFAGSQVGEGFPALAFGRGRPSCQREDFGGQSDLSQS